MSMEEVQNGLFRKQRQGNVDRRGSVRLGQACMDSRAYMVLETL